MNEQTLMDPAKWAEAVTASDGTDHANGPYRAICVKTAGYYKLRTLSAQDVTIKKLNRGNPTMAAKFAELKNKASSDAGS